VRVKTDRNLLLLSFFFLLLSLLLFFFFFSAVPSSGWRCSSLSALLDHCRRKSVRFSRFCCGPVPRFSSGLRTVSFRHGSIVVSSAGLFPLFPLWLLVSMLYGSWAASFPFSHSSLSLLELLNKSVSHLGFFAPMRWK